MLGNFEFYKSHSRNQPTKFFIDFEKNSHLRINPVKKVILFTNARDEKRIKEWAAHHLLIGFNTIYIFDHKSQTPLKDVFKNFDKRVVVERCEMNAAPKLPLMKRASEIACLMKADWFIYLDADEFIILNIIIESIRCSNKKVKIILCPFYCMIYIIWKISNNTLHIIFIIINIS